MRILIACSLCWTLLKGNREVSQRSDVGVCPFRCDGARGFVVSRMRPPLAARRLPHKHRRDDTMADKNQEIAEQVIELVGGKDNISSALHCMTRLRLVLKDDGLADKEALKNVPGVLGVVEQGGQLQVVIGQNVPKVHAAVIAAGVASGGSVDENLDEAPQKFEWTPKNVGNAILGYLSGSMVPMIPAMMAAGMFKVIASVIGPSMLGLVADDSNIITLLNFLYDAVFYFLPIYLGYNAAVKIGLTPMLGAYMGGILIAPAFVELAKAGAPFDVFGIPCTPAAYGSTAVPVLLSVWVMSYIEKFFKKVMPDALSTVFTPFLTMLVITPISLCALAPLGGFLGTFIGNSLYAIGTAGGVFSIIGGGLAAALWVPLVATGMHVTVIMLAIGSFMATGMDPFVLVATNMSLWATYGVELACFLRLKEPNEKSAALGYFISNTIGGVGEPFIYGMLFRRSRLWVTNFIASFAAGALAIALGAKVYNMAASSVLNMLAFVGGDANNLVKAVVSAAVGFAIGLVLTYLFGFTKEEIEGTAK